MSLYKIEIEIGESNFVQKDLDYYLFHTQVVSKFRDNEIATITNGSRLDVQTASSTLGETSPA